MRVGSELICTTWWVGEEMKLGGLCGESRRGKDRLLRRCNPRPRLTIGSGALTANKKLRRLWRIQAVSSMGHRHRPTTLANPHTTYIHVCT